MSITFHWWAIPLVVTIVMLVWGFAPGEPDSSNFPMPRQLATVPVALIIVLVAWLIGALCK